MYLLGSAIGTCFDMLLALQEVCAVSSMSLGKVEKQWKGRERISSDLTVPVE